MIWIVAVLTGFLPAVASPPEEWARVWTPRPTVCRSQWCEQNLYLPEEFSASPGPFRFTGREYQREIVDAVDDPATREVVIQAVPQVGKTEILRSIVCSQGEVDPAPLMLAGPDQPYCREQREIVYRMCDSSPLLRDRVPPERMRNDRWIDLRGCFAYLAWSGSTQRLSGRSCKLVLCSEVDRWQSSIQLATKRTRAFWRSCVVFEGSPVGASVNVWPLYQASDRRHYLVPCPHCGRYQELRFFPHKAGPFAGRGCVSGLQDSTGNWKTANDARRDAYYTCETGCWIESGQKTEMVRRGVWCPDGCEVAPDGTVTGTPTNPSRRRGYQLNALYAPTVGFGDAAEAWIQMRDSEDGVASFWNDWLGLPYVPRGSTPRWRDLGERLAATHPRGTVPKQAYFLVAGADVQENGVYWAVRAFGDDKTSWLVDFGYLDRLAKSEDGTDTALASDLLQLDEVILDQRWPVLGENPLGRSSLGVRILAIDRGYRPTDVDRFVRARPGNRVLAVFGDPHIPRGSLYRPTTLERSAKTGNRVPEGIRAWGIETNSYKSEIADRWFADRTQPGVWWLPSDILTTERGEDYLRHITAETRKLEAVKGHKRIIWELISHATPNHWWDCEVYVACVADMITGGDWSSLGRRAQARRAKKREAAAPSVVAQPYGRPRT